MSCSRISVFSNKASAMSIESFKYVKKPLLAVLQEDWRAMFYDEDSKDFTLTVGVKKDKLSVHKLVLLARCENLRRCLSKNELILPTLDAIAMRKVLQYLYTAEVKCIVIRNCNLYVCRLMLTMHWMCVLY